jgi:hypothetical protein
LGRRFAAASIASLIALCCCNVPALAAEVRLTEGTVVRFADVREGVEAITRRDDYIRQLSPFDRQVRPKTDRDVSQEEFLAFLASHVRPWTTDEVARLTPLLQALGEKLAPWKLKLPPIVLLLKTSGNEEAGAAYCRGAAIVLPQTMIDNRKNELTRILPHEIFHVFSSHNPELRTELYRVIGFEPSNEVQLPEPLRSRKITNPDAPLNNHFITAPWQGRTAEWMPVLISKTPRYEAGRGWSLFSYLDFKLMLLENQDGQRVPALEGGMPVLVEPGQVPGYGEQIGRNTKYIIHPEEVLADNFVLLLDGRIDVPTPRVIEGMGKVLQDAAN